MVGRAGARQAIEAGGLAAREGSGTVDLFFSQTNLRLGLLTKIEAAQTIGYPAGGIPGSRGAGERGARGATF